MLCYEVRDKLLPILPFAESQPALGVVYCLIKGIALAKENVGYPEILPAKHLHPISIDALDNERATYLSLTPPAHPARITESEFAIPRLFKLGYSSFEFNDVAQSISPLRYMAHGKAREVSPSCGRQPGVNYRPSPPPAGKIGGSFDADQ